MKTHKQKVLIVDDEASIRRILETRLSLIGYDILTAADGQEALNIFRNTDPDLVLLDVIMPKLDGYAVCQELRQESNVPIIILTALRDAADRIMALGLGANDYLVKPFSPKELETRIRCVLRQIGKTGASAIPSSGVIESGSLKIDTNTRQVYKGDERIQLTGLEFSLLELLASHSGEPLSRSQIYQEIWDDLPDRRPIDPRVIDIYMARLSVKLEDDPSNPQLILTAPGTTGYLFRRILETESD